MNKIVLSFLITVGVVAMLVGLTAAVVAYPLFGIVGGLTLSWFAIWFAVWAALDAVWGEL